MSLDVVDLRDFYDTNLGRMATRAVRRVLRAAWPDVRGYRVLGFGFATPFLTPFMAEAERVIAAMPAGQGVLHWPEEGAGLVALTDEVALPFPDRSFDRIIIVHGLEHCQPARALLREAWRLLADDGRLLVVVPNRRGLWARLEKTPFAVGQPYSANQLTHLLRDCLFTPLANHRALYMPPMDSRLVQLWAGALERLGQRWFTSFSGVVIAEAAKQIYAASDHGGLRARARRYVTVTGFRYQGSQVRDQNSARGGGETTEELANGVVGFGDDNTRFGDG